MTGRTDHLFKRARSPFWHARFHFPRAVQAEFGKRMEDVNLKTPDRRTAEIRCADLLHHHRRRVFAAMNRLRGDHIRVETGHKLAPGVHIYDDGREIVATADTLFIRMPDGRRSQQPNTPTFEPYYIFNPDEPFDTVWSGDKPKPTKPKAKDKPNDDIVHLERWIAHRNVKPAIENEARDAWVLFQSLVEGKPLAECDRDDGRKLVNAYLAKRNKSKTVGKKVGYLGAAVALAIKEGKLKFNPFADIVPNLNDSADREKLFEDEMATLRVGRDTFKPEQWLLYLLCATTGMRRGEAYSIDREYVEDDIRYVIVGTKTDQSLRRVPLPDAVLPLIPAKITGPLFTQELKNLGRETLRQMRRLGITKDIHGLRHRAKDRLRRGRCPLDIQHHLLGHEEKTVAQGYGVGYPVKELKVEIEKIGF